MQRLLADGRYASASEAVRDGLRLLERHKHERMLDKWLVEGLTPGDEASLPRDLLARARDQVRAENRDGLEAVARGEGVDGDAFFPAWRSRLERRRQPRRRSA